MKRKTVFLVILALTLFALSSCKANGNGGSLIKNNSLSGDWTDNNITSLSIDGEYAYLNWGTSDYICFVDENEKTIVAKGYAWDDSDVEFHYEFINDKLVLDTDNDEALEDTISFERYEGLESIEKESLDGKWTDNNITLLSLDGEKGLLNWGTSEYVCSVDTPNKTITASKYAWDDSDVIYQYQFINGYLVLYSDNEEALTNVIAFVPYDGKTSNNEAEASDSSNSIMESDGSYSLMLGEYKVGDDIKAGTYIITYYFDDFDDEDAEPSPAKVIVSKDGNEVKSLELKDGAEQRIILEEGQVIQFSSDGKDSEFDLFAD